MITFDVLFRPFVDYNFYKAKLQIGAIIIINGWQSESFRMELFMFIRKTTTGKSGSESYFTYRLVNSVRTAKVGQRHCNLGRHFDVERSCGVVYPYRTNWLASALFNLPADLETVAQEMCAKIIALRGDQTKRCKMRRQIFGKSTSTV